MRVLPFDAAPRRVAGISREVIDQVLEKHGLLGAAWNLPASLIRSPAPKGVSVTGVTGQEAARKAPQSPAAPIISTRSANALSSDRSWTSTVSRSSTNGAIWRGSSRYV